MLAVSFATAAQEQALPPPKDTIFARKILMGAIDMNMDEIETMLQPGVVEPVTIKLYPTSNVFKKGHRIRLDISSSNFPRFDTNPNTGEPLGDNRSTKVATNTVWHDASHRSHVTLPLVDR